MDAVVIGTVPDLTVTLDERDGTGPRIAFRVMKDEDQEHPALEASTSGVVTGGTSHRDNPTGESL